MKCCKKNQQNYDDIQSNPAKTVITLKRQLQKVRLKKHATFQKYKNKLKVKQIQNEQQNADLYLLGTCVILGDWTLNWILEYNLSKEGTVRVGSFPGSTVEDIQHHVLVTVSRKLRYMIIHAGTNDVARSSSREISDKILQLRKEHYG